MPQVDYSKIVIYKIQHESKDELLYVGSTTHFRNRKVQHKEKCYNTNNKIYNNKLYTTIRQNGGWDAFNMVIVKEFPCNSKQEALTEEDRIMREMRSSLNMLRAYQPPKERQEYMKEYIKEYHILNRNKCIEYKKKHYEKNIDTIKKRGKERYEQNKEKINNKRKMDYQKKNREQIKCECGSMLRKVCLSSHFKSKKHQTFINQQTDQ